MDPSATPVSRKNRVRANVNSPEHHTALHSQFTFSDLDQSANEKDHTQSNGYETLPAATAAASHHEGGKSQDTATNGHPQSILTQVSQDDEVRDHEFAATKEVGEQPSCWQKFLSCLCCQSGRRNPELDPVLPSSSSEPLSTPSAISMSSLDSQPLLSPKSSSDCDKATCVLDLDETLVHSSFKEVPNCDFVIPVDIDGHVHDVYVCVRPGTKEFLEFVCRRFEAVLFTASLAKYADPVTDRIDPKGGMQSRLFREHCRMHCGTYVKDLAQLGRQLSRTFIIDNSPPSFHFHPGYAIPITSWFGDPNDDELLRLIPFLDFLADQDDVSQHLNGAHDMQWLFDSWEKKKRHLSSAD